jgi:hypothetical protein
LIILFAGTAICRVVRDRQCVKSGRAGAAPAA